MIESPQSPVGKHAPFDATVLDIEGNLVRRVLVIEEVSALMAQRRVQGAVPVLGISNRESALLRQAGCTVEPGDAAGVLLVEESGISAAEVNRLAAQNGITLRQLGERTRSLERAFFALTGTKSADVPDGQEIGAIR